MDSSCSTLDAALLGVVRLRRPDRAGLADAVAVLIRAWGTSWARQECPGGVHNRTVPRIALASYGIRGRGSAVRASGARVYRAAGNGVGATSPAYRARISGVKPRVASQASRLSLLGDRPKVAR